MAVIENKLLNETAKQIASSLFKNIDDQKLDPNFLQNFANFLVKRLYTPQSENVLAETKTVKEFTSLIGQIKKTYNTLSKELKDLQKSIKSKDKTVSLLNEIKAVPKEEDKPLITNEIKGNAVSPIINRAGIDTAEERKEGRPLITKGLEELQSVKVEDFSKSALDKLKEVFSISFGKDLEKTLSTGLKPLIPALSQKQGIFDDLISGGLFGTGALAATGTGALLYKKIKDFFGTKKPPEVASGSKTTPKPPPKSSRGPGLGGLSSLAGKFAIFDAIFNVLGSVSELSKEKEIGTAQKTGAGALALTGVGPDALVSIFDPTTWVSTGYKLFGKESPVGEGAVNELLNVLGLKEKDKSFGETLRGRSVEAFKKYNEYMEDLEGRAQATKERGNVDLDDVLRGQQKAQKQGYILRDINTKVTPKQYALYYHGKISQDEFAKIVEQTPLTTSPQTLQTKQMPSIGVEQTPLAIKLPVKDSEKIISTSLPKDLDSEKIISTSLPKDLDTSKIENFDNILNLQLNPLKVNAELKTTKQSDEYFSGNTITPSFKSLAAPPIQTPKRDEMFQPQQLSLSNDSLQQIVTNTEGTKDSLQQLSRALDHLAVVLDKKTSMNGNTIINTGITPGGTPPIPASVVASNNFDSIQYVRKQFILK